MVGIAGEDDIDAPDLGTPIPERNQTLGADQQAQRKPGTRPILDAEQSAKLRDELIAQIEQLGSADDAAEWARRNIAAKNTLAAADANAVERPISGATHRIGPGPAGFHSRGRRPRPTKSHWRV